MRITELDGLLFKLLALGQTEEATDKREWNLLSAATGREQSLVCHRILKKSYRTDSAVCMVAGSWNYISRRNEFCAHDTLIKGFLIGRASNATTLRVPGALSFRVLTSNSRGEEVEIGVCKRQINEVLDFVIRKLDRN
jgi:hypothetical protein